MVDFVIADRFSLLLSDINFFFLKKKFILADLPRDLKFSLAISTGIYFVLSSVWTSQVLQKFFKIGNMFTDKFIMVSF